MDTDHNTSSTRDTNLDHHNPKLINHPKRKNDLRHTLKLNCNENNRLWISEAVLVYSMKRIGTLSGSAGKVIQNSYGANKYIFWAAANNSSWTNTECQLVIPVSNWLLHVLKFPYSNDSFIIHPSMLYGASLETTPRNPHFFDSESNTEYLQVMLSTLRILLSSKRATKHLKGGKEQAADESQQLSKSTITVVGLRVIDSQNLWVIKMQTIQLKPRWN